MERQNHSKGKPATEVIFDYSIEDECGRVATTLKKHAWYKENGYKPKYPQAINQKLEREEKITDTDILEAVSAEFDQNKYDDQMAPIRAEWDKIKNKFFENLKTLGLPVQSQYFVSPTKYGTGGSYGYPNNVQLNFERGMLVPFTLAHEIVHLTIQPLINEYKIDHWTKERLVDLIMNKFFPENPKLQRDPENAEQISKIFEREFPGIEKIISEVSDLKILTRGV